MIRFDICCTGGDRLRQVAPHRFATASPGRRHLNSIGAAVQVAEHSRGFAKPTVENRPLFGNAFCPLVDRKGASARLSSFSLKVGVL